MTHRPLHRRCRTRPAASPTAHLLDELALYGHRPNGDEPDPRPLPEPAKLQGALADMFDALVATLSDTRLEPDLHALLWSVVNVFHRRIDRIERDLDANETAQRSSQREQDGSEVRSVELERLIGARADPDRAAQQLRVLRDTRRRALRHSHRPGVAAAHGLDGQPRDDDGRDDRQPRVHQCAPPCGCRGRCCRRAPGSPSPAASSATTTTASGPCSTRCMAKHSDMVLLHGGTPRGAETHRRLLGRHAQGPAGRLQARLDTPSEGGAVQAQRPAARSPADRRVVFPGSGVTDNLADKARRLGIPLFDFRKVGGA